MRKIWLDGLNCASLGTGAWKYFSICVIFSALKAARVIFGGKHCPWFFFVEFKVLFTCGCNCQANHVFLHKTSIFSSSFTEIKRNVKPCCLRKSARYFRICTRQFSPLKRLLDNFSCQRIVVDCRDNFTGAGKVLKARIQSFICFVKLNSVASWEILVEWRWA